MNLLTVLLLFTAFLITRVASLRLSIQILMVQSVAVAVACAGGVAGPVDDSASAATKMAIMANPPMVQAARGDGAGPGSKL